jgi:hypothetical protein
MAAAAHDKGGLNPAITAALENMLDSKFELLENKFREANRQI